MRSLVEEPRATNKDLTIGNTLLATIGSLVLVLLLTGCFLASGQRSSSDSTPDGGNVYEAFVSADGTQTRSVPTTFNAQPLRVTVSARTDRGQLRIEILDPEDSVVMALDAQPDEQFRDTVVATNDAGEFRYRIRATGAQNGEFLILYQPGG